jgi:hypothetical protein
MHKYFHSILYVGAILMLFVSAPATSFAQKRKMYPQNYFRWPLDIKPEIVANLGELRSNHWHMGLDIRTQQRENLRVLASAGGYISRVKVDKFGYGRSIVIDHPNGLSTLYAHLNNFYPELEAFVESEQYRTESWAIDIRPPKDKFPVTKGQFIAYSGNTGGSQGPHVHFEIRSTATDECLNPLFFGLPLVDKVKPTLVKLGMYDRTNGIYQQSSRYLAVKNTDSGYIIPGMNVVKSTTDKVSFSIQAYDRISGSNNQDGIYSAQLYLDDVHQGGFILDSISYTETGYMNAHIDYRYKFNGGPYFQSLSRLPGDRGGVYHEPGSGVIHLNDTFVHQVRIELSDTYDQTSTLNFKIQYVEGSSANVGLGKSAQVFIPNAPNILRKERFEMHLPEVALYDTVRSFYYENNSGSENAVSSIHQVNDPSIPVHGNLSVKIKPTKPIANEWRDRLLIVHSYRNRESVKKASWEGQWLTADFGDFGNYQAFVDQVPPEINEPGKRLKGDTIDVSANSSIIFRPTDNFDVIKNFRVELDGKWLKFTNDKGRSHIYKFDNRMPLGIYDLTVTIEDLAGNITKKTWTVKRAKYIPPKKKAVKKRSKTSPTKKKTTTKKK